MDSEMTRRELLAGATVLSGTVGLSGCLGRRTESPDAPPDGSPPPTVETAGAYPLVTYESVDGRAVPTMPVNVRIDLDGAEVGPEAVRDVFRYHPRWSPIVRIVDPYWPFHQSPTQFVWDPDLAGFRRPLASYRHPFFAGILDGEIGYHVYLWPVRDRGRIVGVAGQAHKDVGSLTDHAGTDYHEATGSVADAFRRAGWHTEWASFEYGVADSQRDRWGLTGDLLVKSD